jgi:putative DNA primase/helicase
VGAIRDHAMPIAYGKGSNGKTTILGALLGVFGPDYAIKCPPDLLLARRPGMHTTDLTDLFRKRLVVSIETPAGRRLSENTVKALTGGDPIRARRMREDNWEFLPTHTLIMATNHKPVVRDTDNGIWRRLKLVPFVGTVAGRADDKRMPEKLRAEYPGILAWCVRGCLEWQQMGALDEPARVLEATGEYRREQDRLGAFIEEHIEAAPRARTKAGELYTGYRLWAERAGESAMSLTAFGLELKDRGFIGEKKGGIKVYHDIRLRRNQDS